MTARESKKYTRLLGDSLYGSRYYGDCRAAREVMAVMGPRGIHPAHTNTHTHTSRGEIIWVDLGSNDPRQTAATVLVLFLSTWVANFDAAPYSQLKCNFYNVFFF